MAAKSRSLEEIKSDIALRAGRINPFERVDRKEVDGLLERLTSLDPGFRICRAASGQAWRMSRSQCRRARKTWQKRSGGKLLPSLRILSHRLGSRTEQFGKNGLLQSPRGQGRTRTALRLYGRLIQLVKTKGVGL